MTPEQLKRWNESRKKRYAEDVEYRKKIAGYSKSRYVPVANRGKAEAIDGK